jgi:3-hydroxyisobutyrate dehydrogenase-like beta-hydroxyacid dehydrogenase
VTHQISVGLIGFGEAGSCIGAELVRRGAGLTVYDIAFTDPQRGPAMLAAIEAAGARPVAEPGVLWDADLVLSLVTPASAVEAGSAFAAAGASRAGRRTRWYVDLNSAAPPEKRRIAELVDQAGAVDGVLTGGGIRIDGAGIPIRLSGPDAEVVAQRLRDAGLVAAAIGPEVGSAAALKMLRGVVIKGLESLYVEALLAAESLGLAEPLMESLEQTLDGSSARDYATMLVTTHVVHAPRRQVEAAMIRDTVAAAGLEPVMAAATTQRLARTATALAAAGRTSREVPPTLEAALAILRDLPASGPVSAAAPGAARTDEEEGVR